MTSLHKSLGFAEIHVSHAYEYANAAARTGASGFVSGDIGKIARQTDDNTFYILTATTPTWLAVGGGGVSLASTTPADVGSAGAVGVGTTAARADHVHAGLNRNANDFSSFTSKGTPVSGDLLLIEDSAASGVKKKITIGSLPATGSAFDPRDMVVMDHFVSGNTAADAFGSAGWRILTTGTGADIALSGEAGHPGILDLGPGTTNSGRTAVYMGETGLLCVLPGTSQNQITLEWLIRINSFATSSANNDRITVGFGDQFGAASDVEHNNGIYLEYRPADNANFRLVTAAGGTRTKGNSSTTPTAGNWYRIVLRITFPGGTPTAELLINGSVAVTQTTNMPTLRMGLGIRIDGAATSNEPRVQADYCLFTQVTAKET